MIDCCPASGEQKATINWNSGSVQIVRLVGAEQWDDIADIFWLAETALRNTVQEPGLAFLIDITAFVFIGESRLNIAGTNSQTPYAFTGMI